MKVGKGYKVLVADDEYIICERLRMNLEAEGFEVTGCAENGIQALEMFHKTSPDIIISDISMPALSGIELIQKVREENSPVKFVFLTGFSEFDYAITAIKHNASDYLLKPLDSDELKKVMAKIVEEIESDAETDLMKEDNKRRKDGTLLYHFFAEGKIPSCLPQKLKNLINNPDGISMAMIYGNPEGLDDIKDLYIMANDNMIVFLPDGNNIIDNSFFDSKYCAVGTPCRTQKELSESFVNLRETLLYRFFFPEKHLYKDKGPLKVEKDKIQAMNNQNKELIEKREISELIILIKTELREINTPGNLEYFMFLTKGLLFRETEKLTGPMISNHSALWILERFKNIDEIIKWLEELIIKVFSSDDAGNELNLSLRIKKYLDENYCNPINLDTLAVNVFAHPNYISTKFRETMGVTVTEYLNSIRLERAKELLCTSDFSCKKISQIVGYQDQFYFYKCFRKKFGVTPNSIHKNKSENIQ